MTWGPQDFMPPTRLYVRGAVALKPDFNALVAWYDNEILTVVTRDPAIARVIGHRVSICTRAWGIFSWIDVSPRRLGEE
jgi:hypothetical protein